MTTHLHPEDFVTALEGALDRRVAAHLASCAACRDELAALRARWDEVAGADVPEPSPLFWDHLSARVREATTAAPVERESWWSVRWLAWGLVPAAVVLAAGLMWFAPGAPEMTRSEGVATADATDAAVEFDDVAGLFTTMPADDAEAFAPVSAATWVMVDDLTDEERMVFVRLIEQQMEALP